METARAKRQPDEKWYILLASRGYDEKYWTWGTLNEMIESGRNMSKPCINAFGDDIAWTVTIREMGPKVAL